LTSGLDVVPSATLRKGKARKPRFTFGRWGNVALLVALVTLGLPLAHALFGEVAALLAGAMILGFLLGRWTAS
jgi:hypothetical protein